jgi:hypothetical protein
LLYLFNWPILGYLKGRGQGGTTDFSQIQAQNQMLGRMHGLGNGCGPLELYTLLLAVAKTEAVTLQSPRSGNGQNGAGIQTAAEKNNRFFLFSVHPYSLQIYIVEVMRIVSWLPLISLSTNITQTTTSTTQKNKCNSSFRGLFHLLLKRKKQGCSPHPILPFSHGIFARL